MNRLSQFANLQLPYLKNLDLLSTERMKKCVALIREHTGREHILLDIGSADNRLSEVVECHYIGIDLVGQPTIKADASHGLPLRDRCVDFVFAGELIEHLVDTDAFLNESFRVLVDRGLLLLTTPNLASVFNRLRLLLGKQPLYVENRLREGLDAGHVRAYTYSDLKKQLEEHHFQIIEAFGDCIQGVRPQRLKMWLADVFKTFSHCLIVLCENKSK